MPDTYRCAVQAVGVTLDVLMLDVFNATSSGEIVRVYQAAMMYRSMGNLSPSDGKFRMVRTTSVSGGTTVTPTEQDSNYAALPSQITCGTGRTHTVSGSYFEVFYSSEELPISLATMAPTQLLMQWPMSVLFDYRGVIADVQPLVARETYGMGVRCYATQSTQTADLEMMFTSGAS